MNLFFNKIVIPVLFLLFTLGTSSHAQDAVTLETAKKEVRKKFEHAQSVFLSGQKLEAIDLLKSVIELEPALIDAHFTLGGIYLVDFKNYEAAAKAFETVLGLDTEYSVEAQFYLADALFNLRKYEQAKSEIEAYLKNTKASQKFSKRANAILRNSKFAKEAIQNPVPFEPKNLGPEVNSEFPEYFPALTADEEFIYFTLRDDRGPLPQEDIYFSKKTGDKWGPAKLIYGPINHSEFNEGAHTISPTGKYLFFTACGWYDNYGRSCDILISRLSGDRWGKPQNLGPRINSSGWESQPSISADGKSLFFVSKRKGGFGSADIYMSQIGEDGTFDQPINLGEAVNTPGNEERPFLHPDGQTLYFTSDGHPGMGNADIFLTRKDENGNWQKPENLGYPINTKDFESGIFVSSDGKTAYFSTDREENGNEDIFYFDLHEKAQPTFVTYVKGTVYNKTTKKKLQANIELIDLSNGKVVTQTSSDPVNGNFLVCIPSGKNYAYNVSKENYLFFSENFSLKDRNPEEPFAVDVPLQPIKTGEKVILKNIFFESGSYNLKEESITELKKLVELLTKNAKLKIEIGGHTDNVGDNADNQKLSENRAKAVYDFLIEKKIEGFKISYTGYGESEPVATNVTEEGRAQNRRTEFKVISNY